MEDGRQLQKNGTRVKKSSTRNYKALAMHLKNFSLIKEYDLRIKEYEHLNTREKISEKNYWKKFYLNFCTYLFHEKNCHDNYVGANLKLLRSFFNYLADENNPHPGFYFKRFYVPSEEVPVIVLVPERLNFLIHNKEFEASLPKHLRRIKDMFVFGCTTALRFSDLVALVPANIEKINANTYVCVRSKKTNTFSRVYLPDYATCILAKYRRRKKSLFPPISLTNFNVGLKKIALLAGWTEDMQKIRSKQGIPKEYFKDATHNQYFRFCDVISSHAMRRTAITTMLRFGLNEMNVRTISGHSPNSLSFYRYVNYSNGFMDEELDKYYAKFEASHLSKN